MRGIHRLTFRSDTCTVGKDMNNSSTHSLGWNTGCMLGLLVPSEFDAMQRQRREVLQGALGNTLQITSFSSKNHVICSISVTKASYSKERARRTRVYAKGTLKTRVVKEVKQPEFHQLLLPQHSCRWGGADTRQCWLECPEFPVNKLVSISGKRGKTFWFTDSNRGSPWKTHLLSVYWMEIVHYYILLLLITMSSLE